MHIPCSPKTLFRLHRKLFAPRALSRNTYALSLSHDGVLPRVKLQLCRDRTSVLGLMMVTALTSATWMIMRKK